MPDITINLGDLLISLLIIAVIILIFYIFITIKKLNETIIKINKLFDDNKENVNSSLKKLPEISSNIESISKTVKDKTDILNKLSLGNGEVAASIDFESIVSNISTVIDLFTNIKNYFGNRKTRRRKK